MAGYLIAAVIIFLALGLGVRLLERATLYHPWPLEKGEIGYLTERLGPGDETFEEVSFPTEDGETVTGWLGTPPEPRATLLWFHGNAGNVLHRWDDFGCFVRNERYRVLIVDYRGFGRSTGSPDEAGLYLDARAALDFLEARGVPSPEVFLLGRSIGGAVAIELATARPVKGLILESTFSSAKDMAREMIPFFPVTWFTRSRFPSRERIATLSVPILMFHGRNDRIVPFRHAGRLVDAAVKTKVELVPVDSGHNDLSSRMGDAYFRRVAEFVAGVDRSPSEPR